VLTLGAQVVMEHEHTSNTGQLLGPQQFQDRVRAVCYVAYIPISEGFSGFSKRF
jgi:hypothetical protein